MRLYYERTALLEPDPAIHTPNWQVFPEHVVRGFFNNGDWKDREQSICSIQRSLSNAKFMASKDPEAVWKTICAMLAICLRYGLGPANF